MTQKILKFLENNNLIPQVWGSHIDKLQNWSLMKSKLNVAKKIGYSLQEFKNISSELECFLWAIYLNPKLNRIFKKEKNRGRVWEAISGDSKPDFLVGNTYYEITKIVGMPYNKYGEKEKIANQSKNSQYDINIKREFIYSDPLAISISISNSIAESIKRKIKKKYILEKGDSKSLIIWGDRNITHGIHHAYSTLLFLISNHKNLLSKYFENWKELHILLEDRQNNNNTYNPETKKLYSSPLQIKSFKMCLFSLDNELYTKLIKCIPEKIVYKNKEEDFVEIYSKMRNIFNESTEKREYAKDFNEYKQDIYKTLLMHKGITIEKLKNIKTPENLANIIAIEQWIL